MGQPSDEENSSTHNKESIPYRRHSLASTTSVRSILKQVSSNVIPDTKDENKTITVMQNSFLDAANNTLSALRMGSYSNAKPRPSRRVTFAPEVTLHKIDLIPQYIQPEKGPRRRESFQAFSPAQILRDGPFSDEDELRDDDDEDIGREMLNDSSEDETSVTESEHMSINLKTQDTEIQDDALKESESLSPIVPEEFDSLFDESPEDAFSMELTQIQLPIPYQCLNEDAGSQHHAKSSQVYGENEDAKVERSPQVDGHGLRTQVAQKMIDFKQGLQVGDEVPMELTQTILQADLETHGDDDIPMELTQTVSRADHETHDEDDVPMELTQTISHPDLDLQAQGEDDVPMELTQTVSQPDLQAHSDDDVPMELTQTVSQPRLITHGKEDMAMELTQIVSQADLQGHGEDDLPMELTQTVSRFQSGDEVPKELSQVDFNSQQTKPKEQDQEENPVELIHRVLGSDEHSANDNKIAMDMSLPKSVQEEPSKAKSISQLQSNPEPLAENQSITEEFSGIDQRPQIELQEANQLFSPIRSTPLVDNGELTTKEQVPTDVKSKDLPIEITQNINQRSSVSHSNTKYLDAENTNQCNQEKQSEGQQAPFNLIQTSPQVLTEETCKEVSQDTFQSTTQQKSGGQPQSMEITEQVPICVGSVPAEQTQVCLATENMPYHSFTQTPTKENPVFIDINQKYPTEEPSLHEQSARQEETILGSTSAQTAETQVVLERCSRPSSKSKKGRIKPVCVQELEFEEQEFAASTETPRPSSSRETYTAPCISHTPKKTPTSSSKIRTTSSGSPVSEKKGHKRRKLNNDSPLMDQSLPIAEQITMVEPQTSTPSIINSTKRLASPTVESNPRRASLNGPLTPQKQSGLSLQEKILSLTPKTRKEKKRFSLDTSRVEKHVDSKALSKHSEDSCQLGSPMQFKFQTATSIVPLAETSFLDEQALLTSQDDYRDVSLSEFLSSINVTFYDDLDADCVPYKNGTKFDAKPTLVEYLYASNRLNFLQLLEFSCKELSSNIEEGKKIFTNLEAEILEDNPPLIREYMELQHNSLLKKEMQRDFHLVKNFSRQQARGIWYNWRLQLLKGIEESVTKKVQISKEMNMQLEHQLDKLTFEYDDLYKNRFVVLKDKLMHLRKCKQLSQAVDKEELQTFKTLFDEVNKEIGAKQQEIELMQSQLDSLNKDIASLNEKLLDATKVLETKKNIKEQQLDKSMDRFKKICDDLHVKFVDLDRKSWELKFEMHEVISVNYSLTENRATTVKWLLGENSFLPTSLVETFFTGSKFSDLSENCKWVIKINKSLTKLDLRFPIKKGLGDTVTMTNVQLIENCKVSFEINVRKWLMKEDFVKVSTRYYEKGEFVQKKEDAELLANFHHQTFQTC